jgi:ketose-bisphosphate aldolase
VTLLTVAEILKPSIKNGWAVGAYDVPDISVAQGILDAAVADEAPVILMIYPAFVPTEYYKTYVSFIKEEIQRSGAKAAIALDHGSNIAEINAAIGAGFTGVMIDASKEPFDKNIETTKTVVDAAHAYGISVEAELGQVGLGSDILPEDQMKSLYTKVIDSKQFVDRTGVDSLAVAIGTAHGLYKFEPKLDFERLQQLRAELEIALVLHGSSGTPNDQLAQAVKFGINKINVYTDIRMKVLESIREKVMADPIEMYDIPDLMAITRKDTKTVVQEKNILFGSTGKSKLYK